MRRLYDAWNTTGTTGIGPFVTDDVEWQDAPELPDAETHRGRPNVLRRLSEFEVDGHILRIHAEVEEVRQADEYALVTLIGRATGGSSGAPAVETTFIHLLRFSDDGRVDRGRAFFDPAAADRAFAEVTGE